MAKRDQSSPKINLMGKFILAGREVDPAIREVKWGGETALLEPKSMALLAALIKANGQPVSRDTLVEEIWSGAVVSDDAVHRTVSRLRRGLFDDPRTPSIIGTVPKAGYRLLVSPAACADASAREELGSRRLLIGAFIAGGAMLAATLILIAIRSDHDGQKPQFDFAQARAITSSPGYEFDPALSPDGRKLAYVNYEYSRPDPSLDLYLLDRDTGASELVAGGTGLQAWPAWIPGGGLLYIDGANGECAIKLADTKAGVRRYLAPCADADNARITAGEQGAIYLLDNTLDDKGIFSLHIESGNQTRIDVDAKNVIDIALSPDGETLALVRESALDRHDLYLLPLSTLKQIRLTRESRNIQGIAWTQNGDTIIMSSDYAGLFRLWQLRIADGRMIAIATPGMNASTPATGDHGAPLIYQVWGSEINLQRFKNGALQPDRIAQSNRWEWSPSPSPDGSAVAFLTNRDGSTDLWLAGIDGANPHRIAHFEGWFDTTLSWRPDGKAIALSPITGARFSVVIIDLDGREIEHFEHASANLRDPAFSHDGRAVYYASDERGEHTIRKRLLDGEEEIVAQGLLARLSPAGDTLFAAQQNGAINQINLETAEAEQIMAPRRGGLLRAWTPTMDGLAFLDGTINGGYELKSWNLENSRTTTLAAFDFEIHESSALAQDSDGGFWITRIDQSGSDLWEAPPDAE